MKNIFNVSEEEKNRIRNLHLAESNNPAISSVLKEEGEEKGMTMGELPMVDAQSPMSMGGTQPEPQAPAGGGAIYTYPCRDVLIEYCPNVGGVGNSSPQTWVPCMTIGGQVPTQGDVGKVVHVSMWANNCPASTCQNSANHPCWAESCNTCRIGTILEVCGAGVEPPAGHPAESDFIPCSTPHWHVVYGVPAPLQDYYIVSSCDHWDDGCGAAGESWNCDLGGPLSTGPGSCTSVQGNGGQYPTQQDCIDACATEKRFECVPMETGPGPVDISEASSTSTMVCIQQAMGQYTSMADCQANCGRDEPEGHCINCQESIMNTLSALGGGEDCPPGWTFVPNLQQGPCYECDGNGNCNGPGWFNGGVNVFNSQQECQNGTPSQPACQTTLVDDYECVNGQCTIQSGGQFNAGPTSQDNLNACNAACNVDPCPAFLQSWSWWQQIQSSGPKPCNNICSKIEVWIDANITDPIQNQCYMDYAVTQAVAGGCTCQPPSSFITQKTNHFGNFGCCGELQSNMPVPPWGCGFATGNVKPNSVCGWFDTQCTSGSLGWMKQTKCDWLDNNILGGCNCNI